MRLLSFTKSCFRLLFRRRQIDADLDAEVRSTVEMLADQKTKKGMPSDEARRAAQIEVGGVEQVKEEVRSRRAGAFFDALLQDLNFGIRTLRKNPGFTTVAVLTLALGIGANTAIFSMVNGILLRALPYPQPEQLYAIHEFIPQYSAYGTSLPVNSGNFLTWEMQSNAFSAMALIGPETGSVLGMGHPRWLNGAAVTSQFFSILGVQSFMGRPFDAGKDASGGKAEIILTYRLWHQDFHSDPNVLGKIVKLEDRALTVVGVLPASFTFPHIFAHEPQYFVPFTWDQWNSKPGIANHNYFVIARLKNGVTRGQAEVQLDVLEARIARKDFGGKFNLYANLTPLKTQIVGSTRSALSLLSMAAGLVLLIVCANLASLSLTRNNSRVREVTLRSAFGASPRRLARQFLTETLILACAGGCLGLLFGQGGLQILVRNAPIGIPRVDQIRMDSTVLWFTLGITILTALLFGLLPSLRLHRIATAEALKSSGPTISASKRGVRLRAALVIGEIGLCTALLPACLLLFKSLRDVALANQWMDEDHVISADLLVHMPISGTPTKDGFLRAFHERNGIFASVEQKVSQLPGVENVGFTSTLPLEGEGWGDTIDFQEKPLPEPEQPAGEYRFVSPGYFRAIGLSLIKGRLFSPGDQGQPVAIVSESVDQQVLGGRDPLGMHLGCGNFEFGPQKWCRVIGEVADVRAESDKGPLLAAYFPLWVNSEVAETLVVRTKMNPTSAAGAIREAIWSVDPDLGIPQEKTLKTVLASDEASRRYETSLLGLFAFCAVLLAMLGLYAATSHSVSQRNHEIGIRMALGARRADILRDVVAQGGRLALVGVVFGLAAALGLTRLIASMLFGVNATDPLTFVAVVAVSLGVALVASWIPAQRAMRVDPMQALRHE